MNRLLPLKAKKCIRLIPFRRHTTVMIELILLTIALFYRHVYSLDSVLQERNNKCSTITDCRFLILLTFRFYFLYIFRYTLTRLLINRSNMK